MRLQLIVEKNVFAAADLANAADDAPGLAILDHSRERRALRERWTPGVVRQIERPPFWIAIDQESHDQAAAVGAESEHVRRVNGCGSGGRQGPVTVLAGLDFPKFLGIVVGELRRYISGFIHQPLGVRLPRLIDQSPMALGISE